MTAYTREEDYCQELLELTKEKIELYCKAAVSLSENGALERIRGKLLFKRELEKLLEPAFTEEEIEVYRQEMGKILEKEHEARKRAISFMEQGNMLPLEYICRRFGLGELERHLIMMAWAPELDAQFERVFCLLQDDYGLKMPTIDLCVRILTLDPKERILLQQRIVERFQVLGSFFDDFREAALGSQNEAKASFLSLPLKLNGRILLFLRDILSMDESLKEFVTLSMPGDALQPLVIRKDQTKALKRLVENTSGRRFLYLWGEKGAGKKLLVRHFCRESGRPLLIVHTRRLLQENQAEEKIKNLIRESELKGNAWLLFADTEVPEEEEGRNLLEELLWMLRDFSGIPIFTGREAFHGVSGTGGRSCLEFKVEQTDSGERAALWQAFLPEAEWPNGLSVSALADKYILSPGGIYRSTEEARQQKLIRGVEEITDKMLFSACQRQMVHKLGQDALRVHSPYVWEDLILPDSQKKLLRDACDQVGYQKQIYQDWGFEQKVAYGRGVSMIFYGPPGTGKTMGAQVMANELNLELYKVNMAGVMSRYVGESEKKLDQIFEQGKKSQSILFFDEADVLFGKRSETKDAQDKYANASTAYLLQKVEEYEGILILATNFLQNFDNAFCRRFKFIIEFPFPDAERRLEIWNHVFPRELRYEEEIDTGWLAEEFNFSGSQIKNIVVTASFLAAGEKTGLAMRHILTAVKREQLKVGKHMIASDFGRYYYLME